MPSDYEALYAICMSDSSSSWRHQGQSVAPERFAEFLWRDVYLSRVAVAIDTGRCVGYLSLINADPGAGTAYLSIFMGRPDRGVGFGGPVVLQFLHTAFTTTPLRKIYGETTSQSFPRLGGTYSVGDEPWRGAVVEGRLRNHVRTNTGFEDLVIIAIDRTAFLTAWPSPGLEGSRPITHGAWTGCPPYARFAHEIATFLGLAAAHPIHGGTELRDDLHVDSLTMLEVAEWLESRTGQTIDDTDLAAIITMQDLYEVACGESASGRLTLR